MNGTKTNFQKFDIRCPTCRNECVALYRFTEGVPVIKLVYEITPETHWIRTECCCCWEDDKKTARSSFMAEIPYSGDGEIEFVNSEPRGDCIERSKKN